MIISDLEYLEVISEENKVEGGLAVAATASSSGSAVGDNTAYSSTSTLTYADIIRTYFPFVSESGYGYSGASSTAAAT